MSDSTIKKFNYSLDGQNVNYIRNFQLDTVTENPTSRQINQLKLNTTDGKLKFHDGSELKTLAYAGETATTDIYAVSHRRFLLPVLSADVETLINVTDFQLVVNIAVFQSNGNFYTDITSSLIIKIEDYNQIYLTSSLELNDLQVFVIGAVLNPYRR